MSLPSVAAGAHLTASEGPFETDAVPLPRVTGVVWWKMGISHYKAIYRRARHDEPSSGYTKDYLQAPKAITRAFRDMFGDNEPPYLLTYRWPGGSFQGRIYAHSGYDHALEQGRLDVGQWTADGAPQPWQLGHPASDPVITLPGDPDARIPDEADAQWLTLEPLEPWLMMVQLDHSQGELQLRAHLGAPTVELMESDLARVPATIRMHMRGQGGIVSDLPDVWFDPDDLRDPWRDSPDAGGRESARASANTEVADPARPLGAEYQEVDENARSATPQPFEVDPNERDRGTRAHAVTQNALAAAVRRRGCDPLRPTGEPNYDLAWEESAGDLVVVEVKSINARNEERQLRLGLGQVLRYRHLCELRGQSTRALLAVSAAPSDPRWFELCAALGVGLIWPPGFDQQLGDLLDE